MGQSEVRSVLDSVQGVAADLTDGPNEAC